jgi:hypothetical protein
MKTYTTAQFLKKKFKPADYQKIVMERVRMGTEGYDISDDTWNIHVSPWISEAFGEFVLQLSNKIVKDLKKHNKKIAAKKPVKA